jgi:hypothetical protein
MMLPTIGSTTFLALAVLVAAVVRSCRSNGGAK